MPPRDTRYYVGLCGTDIIMLTTSCCINHCGSIMAERCDELMLERVIIKAVMDENVMMSFINVP